MTLQFSDEIMAITGYRKFLQNESIAGKFYGIRFYKVEGLNASSDIFEALSCKVASIACEVMITSNLGLALKHFLGIENISDQKKWEADNDAKGLLVVVGVGPTKEYVSSNGFLKDDADGDVSTYGLFSDAEGELQVHLDRVSPPIVTALICYLSSEKLTVRLRKISDRFIGKTSAGKFITDVKTKGSFTVKVEGVSSEVAIRNAISNAVRTAPSLNQKSSKFFDLAVAEHDSLKKFLYYFLFIEIEVFAAFKNVSNKELSSLIFAVSMDSEIAGIIHNGLSKSNNIADKFAWCALCVWKGILEGDVVDFRNLKKVRDDIAHGNNHLVDFSMTRSIEKLAIKVLIGKSNGN